MMNRRDTEGTEKEEKRVDLGDVDTRLTREIIGGAIEVHRELGPGLLESVYRRALTHELRLRGLAIEIEKPVALWYKGEKLGSSLHVDIVVESRVLLELKAVRQFEPSHTAQLLTYLRLSRIRLGLLLNFHAATMREGIRRYILEPPL